MSLLHWQLLFSLSSLLTCLTVFTVVLISRRRGERGRAPFLVLLFALGFWQGIKLLHLGAILTGFTADWRLLRQLAFVGVNAIYPATFALAARFAPGGGRLRNLLVGLAWGSALFFLGAELVGGLHSLGGMDLPYYLPGDASPRYDGPGRLYPLYFFTYLGFMAGAVWLLLPFRYRDHPELRNQAGWIALACATAFGVGSLEFYNVAVSPLFPVADLSPAFFAGFLHWAIYRHDFYGGAQRLRLVTFRIALWWLATGIFFAGILLLRDLLPLLLPESGFLVLGLIPAALLATLAFAFVWGSHRLRRRLFPLQTRLPAALVELNAQLASIADPRAAAQSMLASLHRINGASWSAVVLPLSGENQGNVVSLGELPPWNANSLLEGGVWSRPLLRDELLEYLRFEQSDRVGRATARRQLEVLRKLGAEAAIPLRWDEVLGGLLVVGPARHGMESPTERREALVAWASLLASHLHQLQLRELQARRERLAEIGLLTAGVAHEIKNPLEGIWGATQLLVEEGKAEPELLRIVLGEAGRLNDLVHRFLEFARPFRGHPERIELLAFARAYSAEQVRLGLPLDLAWGAESTEAVMADPGALRQILTNLVDNARHFAQAGSAPLLRISQDGEELCLAVEDDGPGVAPEARGKLFVPFSTGRAGGTGLGLALCRKLAEECRGTLTYQPLATGSRFELRLPIDRTPANPSTRADSLPPQAPAGFVSTPQGEPL